MIEQFHLLRPWWLLLLMPLAGAMWMLLKNRYDSGSWRAVIDARLLPFVLSAGAQNPCANRNYLRAEKHERRNAQR